MNKAQTALVWFANMMMQIPEYHPNWKAEFCVEQALEYREALKYYLLNEVDFKKMTIDELLAIGFSFIDDNKTLLLCPLWLANTLFPGVNYDQRGGLIAHGFTVKNGTVLFDKKATL